MGRKLKAIESKISQAEKQLQEARKELEEYRKTKKLPMPEIGGTIEIMDMKWKVVDKTEYGYLCLAEKLENSLQFDEKSNNWETSKLREYLNTKFYEGLVAEVGKENIVPFERNLISLDGQTEYGTCVDKISMVNVDEYRKYRKHIPNAGYRWWTITPDTTECNGNSNWLCVVAPAGGVNRNGFDYCSGVRPFCIFKSAIFESED